MAWQRGRRAAGLACALVAVAAFIWAPGQAAGAVGDSGGPVITSHVDGQRVAGAVEVRVDSTAPQVAIDWAQEVGTPMEGDQVSTFGGVATRTLSTSGYAGLTSIVVRECPIMWGPCDGDKASVQVDVANPPPVWDADRWLNEVHGHATFPLVDEGPWAWYGFFLDGEYVPGGWDEPFFPLDLDYMKIADGVHTLQAAYCIEQSELYLGHPVCDMANASEIRSFTLRTALHPTITDVQPRTISPDENGIADAARVTVALDAPQILYWRLFNGSNSPQVDGGDRQEAGTHTFTVSGRDSLGQPLPSGTYTLDVVGLSVASSPDIDDRQILGSTSTTIVIDRVAPEVTNASALPESFHPPVDGVADQVGISGTLSEPASRLRVLLVRDGVVKRRLWLGPHPQGIFATTWDGRGPKGKLLRPGTYQYDFVARDQAGNKGRRPGGQIKLRWTR